METTPNLLSLPCETILHILSYLDIPDLQNLAIVFPVLYPLTQDPILHRTRIRVVAPSRVNHALFAHGGDLRPTVLDLVHRGVLRGLGIERRWRAGLYFYSPQSVRQYESSLRLYRSHIRDVLSTYFGQSRSESRKARASLQSLHTARVLPDEESSSATVSRMLLPVVRRLKWSMERDKLSRVVRNREYAVREGGGVLAWLEGRGRGLLKESERVRLAVCPGVHKFVVFYENLAAS